MLEFKQYRNFYWLFGDIFCGIVILRLVQANPENVVKGAENRFMPLS